MMLSWKNLREFVTVILLVAGIAGGAYRSHLVIADDLDSLSLWPYLALMVGGAIIAVPILLEKFDDPS